MMRLLVVAAALFLAHVRLALGNPDFAGLLRFNDGIEEANKKCNDVDWIRVWDVIEDYLVVPAPAPGGRRRELRLRNSRNLGQCRRCGRFCYYAGVGCPSRQRFRRLDDDDDDDDKPKPSPTRSPAVVPIKAAPTIASNSVPATKPARRPLRSLWCFLFRCPPKKPESAAAPVTTSKPVLQPPTRAPITPVRAPITPVRAPIPTSTAVVDAAYKKCLFDLGELDKKLKDVEANVDEASCAALVASRSIICLQNVQTCDVTNVGLLGDKVEPQMSTSTVTAFCKSHFVTFSAATEFYFGSVTFVVRNADTNAVVSTQTHDKGPFYYLGVDANGKEKTTQFAVGNYKLEVISDYTLDKKVTVPFRVGNC